MKHTPVLSLLAVASFCLCAAPSIAQMSEDYPFFYNGSSEAVLTILEGGDTISTLRIPGLSAFALNGVLLDMYSDDCEKVKICAGGCTAKHYVRFSEDHVAGDATLFTHEGECKPTSVGLCKCDGLSDFQIPRASGTKITEIPLPPTSTAPPPNQDVTTTPQNATDNPSPGGNGGGAPISPLGTGFISMDFDSGECTRTVYSTGAEIITLNFGNFQDITIAEICLRCPTLCEMAIYSSARPLNSEILVEMPNGGFRTLPIF